MYEGNPVAETAAYLVGGAHPSLRKGEVEHLVYGPETRMQKGARNAMEYALLQPVLYLSTSFQQ